MSQHTSFEVSTQRAYRSLLGILQIAFIFVSFVGAARTHRLVQPKFSINSHSSRTSLSARQLLATVIKPLKLENSSAPASLGTHQPHSLRGEDANPACKPVQHVAHERADGSTALDADLPLEFKIRKLRDAIAKFYHSKPHGFRLRAGPRGRKSVRSSRSLTGAKPRTTSCNV